MFLVIAVALGLAWLTGLIFFKVTAGTFHFLLVLAIAAAVVHGVTHRPGRPPRGRMVFRH